MAKLLIVDDEIDIREILGQILSNLASVSLAADGQEALEMLKREPFHAVLSDIHMPRLNGLELLRVLRENGSHIPFVFLTGYGEKEKAIEALKLGAFDFMEKPWKEQNLTEVMSKALELGAHLDLFASSPNGLSELLEVHEDNRKSSMEQLQRALTSLAQENQVLKKKIENK